MLQSLSQVWIGASLSQIGVYLYVSFIYDVQQIQSEVMVRSIKKIPHTQFTVSIGPGLLSTPPISKSVPIMEAASIVVIRRNITVTTNFS